MNLVPIDGGGTPPELMGNVGTAPEGEFAALMTGLMSGDTQIVPLLDLPVDAQLVDGTESDGEEAPIDEAGTILEFIGTPPAGFIAQAIAEPAVLTTVVDSLESIEDSEEPSTGVPAEASTTPLPDSEVGVATALESGIGSAAAAGLATVHPITSRAPVQTTEATATVTDAAAPGPSEHSSAMPGDTLPLDAPAAPADSDVDRALQPAAVTAQLPESETEFTATPEPEMSEMDVELDSGTAVRPLETGRTGTTISQPAMVGIARRVEEAIAALATKPDPKVVTLQLDELDGMRITVALRPDGIHLSSNGDAGLRAEIERALETRGFDMASNGDRSRQDAEQQADEGWRPTSAGRPRRTNPSGIRF